MEFENLHGCLRKLGEKGPRKTWKKRYFLQRQENINRLYYYINEKSRDQQGFINLEEAISVLKTTDASFKKPHCFQINTPRRIYHLRAETEESMNYWIDGISRVIKRLYSAMEETDSQLGLQLEHANNRISDLELEGAKYRRALQLTAAEIGISVDEVLQLVEQGVSALKDHIHRDADTVTIVHKKEPSRETVAEIIIKEEPITTNDNTDTTSTNTNTNNKSPTEERASQAQKVEAEPDSSESDGDENGNAVDISGHFGAQVIYEYKARKNYELSISENEIITVMSKHENGWWLGCNHEGKQGYFPGSYVRKLEDS